VAREPKMARGKISLARGVHCCPSSFFIYFAQPASLYCEERVRGRVCVYISDCVENVYELSLLPNNIASEPFLHKSGAVGSVEGIFIIGVPAWR
jgi:hypothetical protein